MFSSGVGPISRHNGPPLSPTIIFLAPCHHQLQPYNQTYPTTPKYNQIQTAYQTVPKYNQGAKYNKSYFSPHATTSIQPNIPNQIHTNTTKCDIMALPIPQPYLLPHATTSIQPHIRSYIQQQPNIRNNIQIHSAPIQT